jgi:AcrR family transcriptional regulator
MATKMRQYILDVASELFLTQGINATTVDTIAAKADIAKVTLYVYYKSKEHLILEYLKDYDAKLWNMLSKGEQHQDAKVQLTNVVSNLLDLIGDPNFKGFAFINAVVEFPQTDSAVHQSSLEISRNLRSQLAKLAQSAGKKNADVLAFQLQMVIEGASVSNDAQLKTEAIQHAKSMAKILIESTK